MKTSNIISAIAIATILLLSLALNIALYSNYTEAKDTCNNIVNSIELEDKAREVETSIVKSEVTMVDDYGSYYSVGIDTVQGGGMGYHSGYHFSQDKVWAGMELEVGDLAEVVINADTGELIYIIKGEW